MGVFARCWLYWLFQQSRTEQLMPIFVLIYQIHFISSFYFYQCCYRLYLLDFINYFLFFFGFATTAGFMSFSPTFSTYIVVQSIWVAITTKYVSFLSIKLIIRFHIILSHYLCLLPHFNRIKQKPSQLLINELLFRLYFIFLLLLLLFISSFLKFVCWRISLSAHSKNILCLLWCPLRISADFWYFTAFFDAWSEWWTKNQNDKWIR